MVAFLKSRFVFALVLTLAPLWLSAQPVITEISGIDGEMRANVEVSLSLKQAEDLEQISVWRLRQMASDAREEVRQALEPFGFYSANVSVRLEEPSADNAPWRARVQIEPGEPVIVKAVDLSISEPARALEAFEQWRQRWPLPEGSALRHRPYEQALSEARADCRVSRLFRCPLRPTRHPGRAGSQRSVDFGRLQRRKTLQHRPRRLRRQRIQDRPDAGADRARARCRISQLGNRSPARGAGADRLLRTGGCRAASQRRRPAPWT